MGPDIPTVAKGKRASAKSAAASKKPKKLTEDSDLRACSCVHAQGVCSCVCVCVRCACVRA